MRRASAWAGMLIELEFGAKIASAAVRFPLQPNRNMRKRGSGTQCFFTLLLHDTGSTATLAQNCLTRSLTIPVMCAHTPFSQTNRRIEVEVADALGTDFATPRNQLLDWIDQDPNIGILERIPFGMRGFDLPHIVWQVLAEYLGVFPARQQTRGFRMYGFPTVASICRPFLDFCYGNAKAKSKLSIQMESALVD